MEIAEVNKTLETSVNDLTFLTAKAAELSLFANPSIWGPHCNLESMVIPRNIVESTGSTGSPFKCASA